MAKIAKGKKRMCLTLSADTYDQVASLLKEKDYPNGSLSYYVDRCILQLYAYLDKNPEITIDDIKPLFELEISRLGLVGATRLFHPSWEITDISPEDEIPHQLDSCTGIRTSVTLKK